MSKNRYMKMNMMDATMSVIKNPDQWMRPVTWRGSGQAFCLDKTRGWLLVPGLRGGSLAYFPSAKDCSSVWEVVSADNVNNGE